ncbi:MAG: ABC transporter ATP-binding protein [Solirubrobacteraceae bacterium]
MQVEELTKTFYSGARPIDAIRDVSFAVSAGETLALLGANGAGKSTTVNILATLLRPDRGAVKLVGIDALRHPHLVRPQLGVALQVTGLPRRQTALRLLQHHARLYGMPRVHARNQARDTIDRYQLGSVADRPTGTYSYGQRQCLEIALSLMHRPNVVLLDEPTAGLDARSRHTVWRELSARAEEGTTIVFTTHDLGEAEKHANNICVIDHGAIAAYGEASTLKRQLGFRRLTLSFASEHEARDALSALTGRARAAARHETAARVADLGDVSLAKCPVASWDFAIQDVSPVEPSLADVLESLSHDVGSRQ